MVYGIWYMVYGIWLYIILYKHIIFTKYLTCGVHPIFGDG